MAIDQKVQEAIKKVDSCHDGCGIFRISEQRVRGKKDVVGVSCLKMKVGW